MTALLALLLAAPLRLLDDGVLVDEEVIRSPKPVMKQVGPASVLISRTDVKPLDGIVAVKVTDDERFVYLGPGIRLVRTMIGFRLVRPKRGTIYLRGDHKDEIVGLPSPVEVTVVPAGFELSQDIRIESRSLRTGITPPRGRVGQAGSSGQRQSRTEGGQRSGESSEAEGSDDSPGESSSGTGGRVVAPPTVVLPDGAGGAGPSTIGPSPPVASDSGS
ncbi:MAG: hypothetical protein HY791_26165 [Deltaproteobacteria bacterium]|nr:hypothetical protein [Deltaproteobacteria bacterium]